MARVIDELSDRIWLHEQFHTDLAELRLRQLRKKYVGGDEAALDPRVLSRLQRSAAALSASRKPEHREAAYQIGTNSTDLESAVLDGLPYVLLVILARLGNFPALTYAQKRYGISEDSLPTRAVAESSQRAFDNTVKIGDRSVALTDFQTSLWKSLNSETSIGVSAPTSAGKSFVLQAYARSRLVRREATNIVFLVPTRALINQVSAEVVSWLKETGIDAELVTTPASKDTQLPERAAYVLTQERLQLLQMAHPELGFDLMVVDEAQSITDGPRGVLLSSVIEEALRRNEKMQLMFAGPNIKDPQKLSSFFGRKAVSISTVEPTVTQNILFVDCDGGNPKRAALSFSAEGKKVPLGQIMCDQPLLDHKSKLVNLALRLGSGGQSLIYALGPAECESIAFGLSDVDHEAPQPQALELASFIRDAVHPKYQLANNVLRRVGFHYGRLPSLVRKAVEDAFAEGELDYLVTTSTLLYGVNLPAQNLFLHNPEKGKNQPISAIDFWNLAGRAGRLGKEFAGNVFLVDYGDWLNDPMTGTRDQSVTPSIQTHVTEKTDELIEYIKDPERAPDRNKPDELENTFVKLVKDQLDGVLAPTLDKLGLPPEDPRRAELTSAIELTVANTKLTREVLAASPTVSIHRQDALYDRLQKSLKAHGPQYVIPRHPQQSDAYNSYLAAIKRCHGAILKYPTKDQSHKYYALVCLRWMKGDPLPRIIDASFNYRIAQGQKPSIATIIREVLNEIERDLRFKYVRLFSCYNAVLDLVLRENKLSELSSSIPSVPMYLEVGACSPTMISFMGLGMSRFTAGKLREIARRADMNQEQARAWLRSQDVDALDIPRASIREINRLVV